MVVAWARVAAEEMGPIVVPGKITLLLPNSCDDPLP